MRRAAALLVVAVAACGAPQVTPETHAAAGSETQRPAAPEAASAPPTPPDVRPAAPAESASKSAQPSAPREPPDVRVTLTAVTRAGRARVRVKGDWVVETDAGKPLAEGHGLDADLVLARESRLGDRALPAGASLAPLAEGDLSVGGHLYPGRLRIERSSDGSVRAVIATDLETYVADVVNSEIPSNFPREAQRVQAIVARSYALSSAAPGAPDAPLVLDDVGLTDQEFRGLADLPAQRAVGRDAAQTTRGLVLFAAGRVLRTYYHSTCGGATCPAEPVFHVKFGSALGGVACNACGASKYFHWDATIPGERVVAAAGLAGNLEQFGIATTTLGGRALTFDLRAGGKAHRVDAAQLRLKLGPSELRSTLIESAQLQDGKLVLRGRGWGHGVGLCQMGAKSLAEKGASAESICATYYPGAELREEW